MPSFAKTRPWLWLWLTTTVAVVAFMGATLYTAHGAQVIDAKAEDIASNADPSIRYLDDARTELNSIGMLIMGGL